MSRQSNDSRRLAAAAAGLLALAAGALAGCGKEGPLERPAPLFGSRARAQYEAERAQEAKDDAQRAGQRGGPSTETGNSNAPATRREVLDPNQVLAPASQAPLPGAPNPFGAPTNPAR